MAEGTKICVCVVDVLHVNLHMVKTGVPLSNYCCNMQQGFSIDSVQWSAKQTATGFSMSFFWHWQCHYMGPEAAGMLVIGGSEGGETEEKIRYNWPYQ